MSDQSVVVAKHIMVGKNEQLSAACIGSSLTACMTSNIYFSLIRSCQSVISCAALNSACTSMQK